MKFQNKDLKDRLILIESLKKSKNNLILLLLYFRFPAIINEET